MPTLRLLSPGTLPKIGHSAAFCADCLTIGSRAPADLVLREPSVSPLHARLTRTAAGFLIEDLGSRGGLYVGPRRVARAHVDYRQLFRIGRVAVMLLEDPAKRQASCPEQSAEPATVRAVRDTEPWLPPRTHTHRGRWVLGVALGVAALAVGALFIGRAVILRATETRAPAIARTRFLTLAPDAEAIRFELEPRLSFWVPSAAVSSTAVISATLVERPRAPTTALLQAAGPGAWLDVVSEEPTILGILPLFASQGNAPMPLVWGHYLPRGKRWNFAPSSAPLRLGGVSLVVPLAPARGTVLTSSGHFQFLYATADRIAPQQLETLQGKLEETWQHLDSLGYPLPSVPVLTLLSAETKAARSSSCQSHLAFKLPLSDLSPEELERALFAVAARSSPSQGCGT